MKSIKYFVIALLLLMPFSSIAFGEEAKHEHAMGKEKRVIATMDKNGVQRVEIIGGGYYYDPNYIVVKVNKPVELTVKKEGGFTPHDIVVEAQEAGIDFSVSLDKEPKTIKFTPTAVGKYPMYCSKKLPFVKSHRERGMEGMIEVVE
jgi:plastocyanin domain-containing protein